MTRIYIIRHAEAEGNLFHRAHGWFDGHITATGMEQIAALKTHIINYAKTRETYVAYQKKKAADKPAFRAAHETDLLLHEAAKRAFDTQEVKKLPTVKALQAEYSVLLDKKKAAYEDYKRLRQENQELQAVKSNVDSLLNIQNVEHQEKKKNQELNR